MKKSLALVLFLAFAATISFAQEIDSLESSSVETVSDESVSAELTLGRSALGGTVTYYPCMSVFGMAGGLSYQHYFNSKFGLEGFGYVIWNASGESNPLSYSVGVEAEYSCYEYSPNTIFNSRLFLWGQFVHFGKTQQDYHQTQYGTKTGSDGTTVTDYDNVIQEAYYDNIQYVPNFGIALGFGFDLVFYKHICIPIKFGLSGDFTGIGFSFGSGLKYIW